MDSAAQELIQIDQTDVDQWGYHSLFRSAQRDWVDNWCIPGWSVSNSVPENTRTKRLSSHSLCQQVSFRCGTSLLTNREGGFGNCLGHRTVSPLPLRTAAYTVHRLQASPDAKSKPPARIEQWNCDWRLQLSNSLNQRQPESLWFPLSPHQHHWVKERSDSRGLC